MGVIVYRIDTPSGVYFGQTADLHARMQSHWHRALVERKDSPLYRLMRSEPESAFVVSVLASGLSRSQAQDLEVAFIAEARSTDACVLNQTRGGAFDMSDGARLFWRRVSESPVLYAEYFEKLSSAAKRRYPGVAGLLLAGAEKWRSDNPRGAYAASRRAFRMATKAQAAARAAGAPMRAARGKPTQEQSAARALKAAETRSTRTKSAQRKFGIRAARRVRAVWATRSPEARAEIGGKISQALVRAHADPERKAEVSAQLQGAREKIDREKQGRAASAGLKAFWEEIRRDPARYQEYIETRKASQKRTRGLKNKKGGDDARV